MAKKGQKATWENDNFQNAKKTKVAKVKIGRAHV